MRHGRTDRLSTPETCCIFFWSESTTYNRWTQQQSDNCLTNLPRIYWSLSFRFLILPKSKNNVWLLLWRTVWCNAMSHLTPLSPHTESCDWMRSFPCRELDTCLPESQTPGSHSVRSLNCCALSPRQSLTPACITKHRCLHHEASLLASRSIARTIPPHMHIYIYIYVHHT